MRFSIVIMGCAALALAACGGAGTATGSSPASKASASPATSAGQNGNCTPPPGVVTASPGGNAVNMRGKITSVSGTSFVVQPVTAGDAPVTVNVPSTALITRLDTTTTSRLAVGECVRVNGQRAASGVVQARALVITQAGPNGCAAGGPGGGQPRPSSSAATGA